MNDDLKSNLITSCKGHFLENYFPTIKLYQENVDVENDENSLKNKQYKRLSTTIHV